MNSLLPHKHRKTRQNTCLSSRAKILALFLFLSAFSNGQIAHAATWEWVSIADDKERLVIKLDEPMPSIQSTRNGSRQIQISTPLASNNISLNGTGGAGEFVDNINVVDGNIQVNLKKADFGYIATQPDSTTIFLEFYQDPMMLRFFPEDGTNPLALNPNGTLPISPRQANQANSSEPLLPTHTPEVPVSQNPITQPPVPAHTPVPTQENTPNRQSAQRETQATLSDDAQQTNPLEIGTRTLALADTTENESNIVANKVTETIAQSSAIPANSIPRPSLNPPRTDITQNQFSVPRAPQTTPVVEQTPIVEEAPAVAEVEASEDVAVTNAPQGPIFYGNNFKAEFKPDVISSDKEAEVTNPQNVMQSEQQNPYEFSATYADSTGIQSTSTPRPTESTALVSPIEEVTEIVETPQEVQEVTSKEVEVAEETPTELAQEDASIDESTEVMLDENGEPIDPELIPTMPETLEEAIAQNRPIIYQDKDGNPVPPPPDPVALMAELEKLLSTSAYAQALPIYETLLTIRLSKDDNEHIRLKEQMLTGYARALFAVNEMNLSEQGQAIIDAALTAMNYNPESPAVPELLMMIARVHLAMGNLEDAEGYILMLTQLFPNERNNAPYLLLMLAREQFDNGAYVDTVNTTQLIADNFSDMDIYRDASILQATAYYRQGHYDKALPIVRFVSLRWPDAYIDYPEFLSVAADIMIAQELYAEAADLLWIQYNLDPTKPESPDLLNRITLLYYTLADKEGANKVQLELINSFPESIYTPAAMIRLSENTFLPSNPSLDTLLNLFAQPNPRLQSITYQQVIDEFPESPEAIEAKIRLAAWEFYHQNYDNALSQAQDIMQQYPEKPHYNVANEILLRSFEARLTNALEEENFARALSLWETYPEVHNYYQPFEDDLRVALARGYLNRGETQQGLDLLKQFINPNQNEKYGIYTYNLFLTDYLNKGNWAEILTLDDNVTNWNMPLDVRNQHRYTVALASENLGLPNRALPLWEELVDEESIPLYQRAYANYFLARDAEYNQDLRQSYQHNLDALAMFEQLQEENSDFSDPQRIRESIAALMDVTEVAGRFAESLDWLNRYASFVPQDSPDYAGLMLREARLYRKMGDMVRWQIILEDIVAREPDSVFGEMAASELSTQAMARDIDRFLEN